MRTIGTICASCRDEITVEERRQGVIAGACNCSTPAARYGHADTVSRLNNKSLVVIGGTSGLGLSAAKAFVAEGAKVVVVGRDEEKVEEAENEVALLGVINDATGLIGDQLACVPTVVDRLRVGGRLRGVVGLDGGRAETLFREKWQLGAFCMCFAGCIK